jgi:hypothetical protein
MTSREFGEWVAYFGLQPFGEWAKFLRAGIVASACLAPWQEKGERSSPGDFIPQFDRPERGPMTEDEAMEVFRQAGRAFGRAGGGGA